MNAFEQLTKASSDADVAVMREELIREGYPAVRRFLDRFYDVLREFDVDTYENVTALLDKARLALPNPGEISPSWTYIWERLGNMAACKLRVLQAVKPTEREGEWQILIDNPYMNREVACYPGLTFAEAAYIYAKFRPNLEKNEYIRLQRIETHITEFGERRG